MQLPTAIIAAFAAFLPSLVSAHVSMIYPPSVYNEIATGLNPLAPDGSNYPCFVTTGSKGDIPVYELGSKQEIGLQGSAVHGGGSCQISITYDVPPKKDSVFKVLASFEGGCPLNVDGNLPANPGNKLPSLPYTLPKDIPSGGAVIAWTWFNKIGNREMYMRCAPIKIDGTNKDTSAFNALPDMFKANIGNGCSTTEGSNVIFPNPGAYLTGQGTGAPVGSCGAVVFKPSASSKADQTTSSKVPILVVIPTTTPVAAPTPTPTPTSVTGPGATETPVPTPLPDYRTIPTPTPTPQPVPTPIPEQQPSNGTCVDGTIVCTGLNTWSVCDHGKPTPMGQTAAGMNCKGGKMVLAARSVRFSHAHARRRHGSIF